MKDIGLEELKKIQVDILRDVHLFCEQNDISYSLAYGTLLGAVRHKGYIPWDDDIDIMMLRKDYDKFIELFPGSIPHLDICAPELDLDYYAPYANVWDNRTVLEEGTNQSSHKDKIIGVKIDVFPIDKTSSNLFFVFYTKLLFRLWCSFRYRSNGSVKKNVNIVQFCFDVIANMVGYKALQKKIMKNAKRYSNSHKEKLDMLVFYNVGSRAFSIKDFDSYVKVSFEDGMFNSLAGYDDYLRSAFGDYMELPPIEQRFSHHKFMAYWQK